MLQHYAMKMELSCFAHFTIDNNQKAGWGSELIWI
jgi:hypothetical protein